MSQVNPSSWVVLFDVRTADYQGLYFPLVGLILIVVAVVTTRIRTFSRDAVGETVITVGMRGSRRLLAFAILWTMITGALVFGSHSSLATALDAGAFTVVEGQVEQVQQADLL